MKSKPQIKKNQLNQTKNHVENCKLLSLKNTKIENSLANNSAATFKVVVANTKSGQYCRLRSPNP